MEMDSFEKTCLMWDEFFYQVEIQEKWYERAYNHEIPKCFQFSEHLGQFDVTKMFEIDFMYSDNNGNKSHRTVNIGAIFNYKGDNFISGYCYLQGDWRTFKLSRTDRESEIFEKVNLCEIESCLGNAFLNNFEETDFYPYLAIYFEDVIKPLVSKAKHYGVSKNNIRCLLYNFFDFNSSNHNLDTQRRFLCLSSSSIYAVDQVNDEEIWLNYIHKKPRGYFDKVAYENAMQAIESL